MLQRQQKKKTANNHVDLVKSSDMGSRAVSKINGETSLPSQGHSDRQSGKNKGGMEEKHMDSIDGSNSNGDSGDSARSAGRDTSRDQDSIEYISPDGDPVEESTRAPLAQLGVISNVRANLKAPSDTSNDTSNERGDRLSIDSTHNFAASEKGRDKNARVIAPTEDYDWGWKSTESESASLPKFDQVESGEADNLETYLELVTLQDDPDLDEKLGENGDAAESSILSAGGLLLARGDVDIPRKRIFHHQHPCLPGNGKDYHDIGCSQARDPVLVSCSIRPWPRIKEAHFAGTFIPIVGVGKNGEY